MNALSKGDVAVAAWGLRGCVPVVACSASPLEWGRVCHALIIKNKKTFNFPLSTFHSLDDEALGGGGVGGAEGEEVGASGVLGEGDGELV